MSHSESGREIVPANHPTDNNRSGESESSLANERGDREALFDRVDRLRQYDPEIDGRILIADREFDESPEEGVSQLVT